MGMQPYVPSKRIGIIVEDTTNRRLIDSAVAHLGLTTEIVNVARATADGFQAELIIADEPAAKRVIERLKALNRGDDPYRPALVAVIPEGFRIDDEKTKTDYDGVLPMPQLPDALAAQLSITLYSHRSFTTRYEDQLEELQLSRNVFSSVTSGISVTSIEGDHPLTYVNPSFEALTGYTLEEVKGKNCRFLQRDERDQASRIIIREALEDGRSATVILRNYRKDGTAFWNELSLAPIKSRSGIVTHFIGIQNDVTERVDLEVALREREKLAVTGRLAAVIAHEINNPMEAITTLVYLALHSDDIGDIHGFLQMADDELRRMKAITTQSLRFSRQSTRPEAIYATKLVESTLELQRRRMQVVGVCVERRDRGRETFVGMENDLRQVLNNLISNATDSMKGRPGIMFVRTHVGTNWRTGHQGIIFTVADHGEGMSEETKKKLFEAFYSTKGERGNGLGLWITTDIVQRHHGRLLFRSSQKEGSRGTVFRLFLPHQAVAP